MADVAHGRHRPLPITSRDGISAKPLKPHPWLRLWNGGGCRWPREHRLSNFPISPLEQLQTFLTLPTGTSQGKADLDLAIVFPPVQADRQIFLAAAARRQLNMPRQNGKNLPGRVESQTGVDLAVFLQHLGCEQYLLVSKSMLDCATSEIGLRDNEPRGASGETGLRLSKGSGVHLFMRERKLDLPAVYAGFLA